jgi:hypothetical protein
LYRTVRTGSSKPHSASTHRLAAPNLTLDSSPKNTEFGPFKLLVLFAARPGPPGNL